MIGTKRWNGFFSAHVEEHKTMESLWDTNDTSNIDILMKFYQ